MKKLFPFLFICAIAATSCSKDNSDDNNNTVTNYLPQESGNYWTYNVTGSAEGTSGRDSVYVAGDTTISGVLYKKMKSRNPITGFYSNSVNNNAVRTNGTKIELTGSTSFDLGGGLPVTIALTDFVVFDSARANGAVMDTFSGTIQQTLNGTPLTIDYTLTSTAGPSLETYVAPDQASYQNVKSATIRINLKVSTDYQGFPIVVLPSQDVVTSVQYYAQDYGVVNSDTTIQYAIDPTIAAVADLAFPATGNETQTETLDTFLVQ